MIDLLHTHWLWVFGALALGVVVGWIANLHSAPRWSDRSVQCAIAVVALAAILAIARVVPGRYGYWLELGVTFAVVAAIGCFIGRALRGLADFTPAPAKAGAASAAATTGSYLYRDAYAGTATSSPYMRTATQGGAPAREPLVFGEGALTRAPAAGGYTFPKSLPFADAPTSRAAAAAPGVRRHWSWPRPADVSPYVTPEFTGSKGGYIFPLVGPAATPATTQPGTTRAGLYRHWSWRGAGGETPAAAATAESSASHTSPPAAGDSVPGAGVPTSAAAPFNTASGHTAAADAAGGAATPPVGPSAAASLAPAATGAAVSTQASAGSAATTALPGTLAAPVAPSPPSEATRREAPTASEPSVPPDSLGAGGPAAAGSVETAGAPSAIVGGGQTDEPAALAGISPASQPDDGGPRGATDEPPSPAHAPAALAGVPPTVTGAGPAAPPAATTPAEAGLSAAPPAAPGEPATIAAVPGEDRHPGHRPEGLMTARDDRADDLKRIRGIGPLNEGRLHGLGIWHFDQIAGWSPDNVRWVGSYLAFPGRIDREKWVEQAVMLASGGAPDVPKRMRAGKLATSQDDGGLKSVAPTAPMTSKPRRPRR